MTGMVALVGGSEHTPGCEATDRLLLRQSGLRHPEVVVVLAASPDRRRCFKRREADGWWPPLGARVRCAFAGEADPVGRAAVLLAAADLIVLAGGRPWLLYRRLRDTSLGALLRERWELGVPISGSSAGAMALAEAAWSFRAAAPFQPSGGLGLVPGTLVAPHAGRHGVDRWAALTQAAHPGLEVLGIPDRTALLVHPDGERTVAGPGALVRYADRLPAPSVSSAGEAPAGA